MRQRARPDLWEPGEGDFPGPPDCPAGTLVPRQLLTHEFKLHEMMKAYDTFSDAAKQQALKVIIRT